MGRKDSDSAKSTPCLSLLLLWLADHPCCQEQAVLTESVFQPLGNSGVPEYAVIDLAGPTGPPASPNVEIWCLSQVWTEGAGGLEPPSLAPLRQCKELGDVSALSIHLPSASQPELRPFHPGSQAS